MTSQRFQNTLVFADGASSGNPGPGGWGSIIVTSQGQVTELGGGERDTTNNRMELTAVIRALNELRGHDQPIDVFTDSVYVIRGITQWVWGWMKRGWKNAEGSDVLNQDLWRTLISLVSQQKKIAPIEWHFVRGHSGVPGNERVDQIAVEFSKGRRPALYRGSLLSYDVSIHDIPENTDLPEQKPKQAPSAPAYGYLSLIGGVPMRHKTWAECERRVKGQSGAKFKKVLSAQEEAQILNAWGYRLEDVK